MKYNQLTIVVPMKWLSQDTQQARTQAWAQVTQILLPDLGQTYSRFYPVHHFCDLTIEDKFGVVLGIEDPVTFLNVLSCAQKKREEAIAYHAVKMLEHIDPGKVNQLGNTLVCHIVADGSNQALSAHALWHSALMSGVLMPDSGIYYMEQKNSILPPNQEKAVSLHPADYALCAVTLEAMEENP